MSSPASDSTLEGAYDKLHPTIRRWIRDQGWDELREIQARTINSVLEGDRDILIEFGRQSVEAATFINSILTAARPGFWPIAVALVLAFP